jgi:hypothetical protein
MWFLQSAIQLNFCFKDCRPLENYNKLLTFFVKAVFELVLQLDLHINLRGLKN